MYSLTMILFCVILLFTFGVPFVKAKQPFLFRPSDELYVSYTQNNVYRYNERIWVGEDDGTLFLKFRIKHMDYLLFHSCTIVLNNDKDSSVYHTHKSKRVACDWLKTPSVLNEDGVLVHEKSSEGHLMDPVPYIFENGCKEYDLACKMNQALDGGEDYVCLALSSRYIVWASLIQFFAPLFNTILSNGFIQPTHVFRKHDQDWNVTFRLSVTTR